MRSVLLVLAVAASAHAEEIVSTKEELAVTGAPWTVVQTSSGSIQVHGGPEGHVYVESKRRAPTKKEAEALLVDVTYKNGVVRIIHPKEDKPNRDVSFVVQVPAGSRVQVVTGAGQIEIFGTTGGVAAASQAGQLKVHDVKGELNLKTQAGELTVENFEGALIAQTGAGAIKARGKVRGVSTVSAGAGAIDIAVPVDARLKIEAATQAGVARNGFGIPGDGHQFSGTLGDGRDGSLAVRTATGEINVHKMH